MVTTATRTEIGDLLGSSKTRELTQLAQAIRAVGVEQFAYSSQVAKGVDARVVPVAPSEPQCVVADGFDVAQLQIAASLELNAAGMTLAPGTRAETAQDFVRISAAMPVAPVDLHFFAAMGGFDSNGSVRSIERHRGSDAPPAHDPCPVQTEPADRPRPGSTGIAAQDLLAGPTGAAAFDRAMAMQGLAQEWRLWHIRRPLPNPSESIQCRPLEVQVGDKGIERAIKHLKRKMASEGILRELKRRRHYMKPSIKRRKKMSEAARRRRKRLKTDAL